MNKIRFSIPPFFMFLVSMFLGIKLSAMFIFEPIILISFYLVFVVIFIICVFFNLVSSQTALIVISMIFFLSGIVLFRPFETLEEGESTLVGKIFKVTETSVRLTQVKALENGSWKVKSGEFYALLPDYDGIEENEYLAINGVNSKLGHINFIRSYFKGDYFSYVYRPSFYEKTRGLFQSFSNSFIEFLKTEIGTENGSIAAALFLGLGLDRKNKDMINKSGISYLFVVSGFHFFLVYFIFTWILALFKPGRLLNFLLKTVFLFVFFMTCSVGPSSFRAFLMILVYELFKFIDYPVSPLSVLGISGLIILIGDPAMALNSGFQMTYGAVLGILIFSSTTKNIPFANKYLVPLGSLLFIIPITALNFGVVPLLSVPIGLILSLSLIPFIMICLFVVIVLYTMQLQLIAGVFLKGFNPLLSLSRGIVQFLAGNYGTIQISKTVSIIIATTAVMLIIILFFIGHKKGHLVQSPSHLHKNGI